MFTSGLHLLVQAPPEKKLTSTQVSEQLKVPRSTLRYWEKEFAEFIQTQEGTGKHRRYGPKEIETLKEIQDLLETKQFTIAGAKRRMAINRNNGSFEDILNRAVKDIEKGKPFMEVAKKLERKLDL